MKRFRHTFCNSTGGSVSVSGGARRNVVVLDVNAKVSGLPHGVYVANDLSIEQATALRDSLTAAIAAATPPPVLFRKGQYVTFGGFEKMAKPKVWEVIEDCYEGDNLIQVTGNGDKSLLAQCGHSTPYVVKEITTTTTYWARA